MIKKIVGWIKAYKEFRREEKEYELYYRNGGKLTYSEIRFYDKLIGSVCGVSEEELKAEFKRKHFRLVNGGKEQERSRLKGE